MGIADLTRSCCSITRNQCLITAKDRHEVRSAARSLVNAPLPVPFGWYAAPLRLIIGLGFIEHGYAKLARGPDAFIAILRAIGMPFADPLAWATIAVEIVGGLLVLVGAFVSFAALPMAVVLVVAIVTVHLQNGFSSIKLLSYDAAGAHFGQPGYETDLLYLAGLISLSIGGAGPFSLDGYLNAWRKRSSGRAISPWLRLPGFLGYFARSASTPGRALPSIHSRNAPPAADT